MQGEISKGKRRKSKRNKLRNTLRFSQEKASYFFFIGLLIIAIFGCVASGAPRQGFYGILFVLIGILIALFPPVFITSKWLNIGVVLFFISLSASLLPRSFAGNQAWRTNLESLGLKTGSLISTHPAETIESLIIIGSIIIIGLCSLGHRISRESFLKIASLFVLAISLCTGIAMLFVQNEWDWVWKSNNQFGFFANRNHMATLMVMASLVGVGSLFVYLKKKNWKAFIIMLLATGIICWAILGYSISRAGLILFISFQLIWFSFLIKRHLNYKQVISFLVLFSLAIILFFLSDTKLEERIENLLTEKRPRSELINIDNKSDYSSILGVRKYIHTDTIRMIQSEPWTGIGLGVFEYIFPFYKIESISSYPYVSSCNVLHPESNWLDLTAQAGISSTILLLVCLISILLMILSRNIKSRSWILSISSILSAICIMIHGLIDVPGQKIGIIMSAIVIVGITLKYNRSKDNQSPIYVTLFYQIIGVVLFSLGLILIVSQWTDSKSIAFSDTATRIKKIQDLYDLSIDAAIKKDEVSRKAFIMSAINLCEKAISRSPIDSDLHFIRGKLYGFLDGNENIIKSSFKIESALDPGWLDLPLRQAKVWLFIDNNETRKLWTRALDKADRMGDEYSIFTWSKILAQARQHPIQIRTVYEIIIHKDDPNYIKKWMDYAGRENLSRELPKILKSKSLSGDNGIKIMNYWERIAPLDFEKYIKQSN